MNKASKKSPGDKQSGKPTFDFRPSEIRNCMTTCKKLFETGVFSPEGVKSPLFEAATVQLLICLNDLVRKADNDGKRISFADHVQITDDVKDVTDLITKMRNAACHIGSPLQNKDTSRFRFMVIVGRYPEMVKVNGVTLGSDFEDDIAVYYGTYRLYIGRHIVSTIMHLEKLYADVLQGGFPHHADP